MARVTRSASKVSKPAVKSKQSVKESKKKNAKKSEKVLKEIEQVEKEKDEDEGEDEEADFQLPSDSDSDSEDGENVEKEDGETSEEESDSELAVHEDVINESGESTNKSGHTITKPILDNKNKKKSDNNSKRGVIYIGRLPNGFEEKELKTYFQQFGDITRLRLSRNKKTGNSKHYAFIEFKEEEVAKIAAETMNNYLLMGHLLKCTVLNEDKIHENLFDGANKKFKVIPFKKISLAHHDKKRTVEEWEALNNKHLKSIEDKQKKLNEKGINFDLSEL